MAKWGNGEVMKKKFCIKRELYKINALTIKLQILLRYNII